MNWEESDVNEVAEAEWIAETTPAERVREVVRSTYEPQPISEIAARARTTPETARPILSKLVEDGFATTSPSSQADEAAFRRSSQSLVIERARHIQSSVDHATLTERIEEMQAKLDSFRAQTDAESPQNAALAGDVSPEILQEWQTLQRNFHCAKVALALDEAQITMEAI